MIVGTAGHIDHGKTTLVKALTGVDTDRLKEEKARGITIDLGFAYCEFLDGTITGFVDVPGHDRFIHTMLAGACGIDFALLVVAADDGIKPQTREHLAILELLGINRGVVAISKADLADESRRMLLTEEIRALIGSTGLRDAEVIPVSAVTGEGMAALREAFALAERSTRSLGDEGRFRLAVDRCFSLTGAGTIVTGTVLSGSVAVGDHVVVSPSGIPARVRSIHAQSAQAQQGSTGQRCALNLAGESVSKEAIGRGDVVVVPILHAPTDRIDAELHVLATEPKVLGEWFSARLHHGSTEVGVRLIPLEKALEPGQTGLVQLVLDRKIAATVGDRYILRDVSAQRTIGGGAFIDLRAPQRKRRSPERLEYLRAAAIADTSTAIKQMLVSPPHILDLGVFARDRALSEAEMERLLRSSEAVMINAPPHRYCVSRDIRAALTESIQRILAEHHAENPDQQGLGRERLRLQATPRMPADAFLAVLRAEQDAGGIVLDGAFVRLKGHQAHLTDSEETLFAQLIVYLDGEDRFRPPRVRDLSETLGVDEKEIRRVLKLCARLGRVDQIRHDHFFTRSTTAEMVDIIKDVAGASEDGQFVAGLFRDRLNNGRKVAIEILDFFDRQGVTIRRGDLRRVNPHRLDIFETPGEASGNGRDSSPVGRPDFKSGWGSEAVLCGFDSHSLPPTGKTS